MGTISVPSKTLCLTLEVANGDICFFDRKRLEPKELLWQQHEGCHFVSFVMYICGAKFQEHCFNISRDISKTNNDISKRKTPFFSILKGLSNKHKLFFMSYTLQGREAL